MSSLGDALKKAGLVDDKKAKQAERDKRKQEKHERKQLGKAAADEPTAPEPTLEERQAEAAEHILRKLLLAADEGVVSDAAGRRKFYFEARDHTLPFLSVSDVVGLRLERGRLAIAEDPRHPGEHLVVTRDAAIRMASLDADSVRFFLK